MKILVAVPSITPGSGLSKYILSLSTILTRAGREVAVLTTHTEDAAYERRMLAECGVTEVGQFGHLSKLKKYAACLSYINRYRADVLINNYDGLVQILLPLLWRRPRVVHVLHNERDDFYRVGAINGRLVAGWIAPTQAIADKFNEYTRGRYAARVSVIPHGVEPGSGVPETPAGRRIELTFVGVHHWHKGIRMLPLIARRLMEEGLDFRFTVVGKGAKSDWLRDAMADMVAEGYVTFTGVITAREVYRLQAAADIFVYPTHTDAFGLVIAEAMMNATVPVVTNLVGITDNLIDDGVDGFLVTQDDADMFVARIMELARNPRKLAEMKALALEKARTRFSFEAMADNYLKYLSR